MNRNLPGVPAFQHARPEAVVRHGEVDGGVSRQSDHELRSLLAMSSELAQNPDPDIVGDLIARHIAKATGVDECCISYLDESASCVVTYGYFPPERRAAVADSYCLDDYPATREVISNGRPVLIDVGDPTADPAEVAYLRSIGNQVAAMLPLVTNGAAVGLAELTSGATIEFDERRLALAQTMANETAMAIQNARLLRDLRHQAFHDPLTGLPNRSLFADRLEHALARSLRGLRSVAVLFLDLDDFKMMNDSLGHGMGDKLLEAAGRRLKICVRPGDTVARLGGDEFAVLAEDIDSSKDAEVLAQRILRAFDTPLAVDDVELIVRASIGITIGRAGEAIPDELLRSADLAMYQAKSLGKGRYQLFEPKMQVAALERIELAMFLRRALEQDEFVLHYQPIVDLKSGAIRGVEALVRWQHPERGLIMPNDFIPLAEETGLIVPLGRWVLRQACRQAEEWQARYPSDPPLTVSVNVSARQFSHPGFVAEVGAVLEETRFPPASLTLELTESLLMVDTEATVATLSELKRLGVRLAVDDFGTGYSSLSYLQRFPIDVLKIDKAFVDAMSMGTDGRALVRSIIELGQSLHLQTVAEGVERADQPGELRDLRCDMAQGFYLNRPEDAEMIDAALAGSRSLAPA